VSSYRVVPHGLRALFAMRTSLAALIRDRAQALLDPDAHWARSSLPWGRGHRLARI